MANLVRDPQLLKDFGNNLKAIREKKGISQRGLATLCLIEHSQIGRIERGEVNTTISTLFLIADKLGVKPEELVRLK